jgi:hypothetical protein
MVRDKAEARDASWKTYVNIRDFALDALDRVGKRSSDGDINGGVEEASVVAGVSK